MFLLVLIAKERKEHNVRQFLWISLVLRSLRKVPCALFSFFLKIVIFLFLHVFSPFSSLLHFTPISVDFYFFPYIFCLIHLCQANNHVQRQPGESFLMLLRKSCLFFLNQLYIICDTSSTKNIQLWLWNLVIVLLFSLECDICSILQFMLCSCMMHFEVLDK